MRWLVDGMNVIGSGGDGWWRDRHAAMVKLVDRLERWSAATGEDVTVVFEKPPNPPIVSTVVDVTHAPRPRPDSADDEILRLLEGDPHAVVVTSDRALADAAAARGAAVHSARGFSRRLDDQA